MILPGVVAQSRSSVSAGPQFIAGEGATVSGTSLTVNLPSGVSDGDFLVFCVFLGNVNRNITSAPGTLSLEFTDNAADNRVSVYTRVASSEPSNYTFTIGSFSDNAAVVCLAYRGVSSVDVEGSIQRNTGFTIISAPSISIPTSGGVLVAYFMDEALSPTISSPPTGLTQRTFAQRANANIFSYDKLSPAAGATGDSSITFASSGSSAKAAFQLHLV